MRAHSRTIAFREVRTLVSVWRLRRKQGTRHSRPHHHSRSTQSNCDSNSHFVPPRVVTALRTEGVCLAPRPAPQRTQLRCGPAQAQHSLRQPKGLPSGILAALLLDLGPPANAVALRLLSLTPGRHGQRRGLRLAAGVARPRGTAGGRGGATAHDAMPRTVEPGDRPAASAVPARAEHATPPPSPSCVFWLFLDKVCSM